MTPAAKRMRRSFVILVTIGIALNAALLVIFAQVVSSANSEVQQIRGDFCTFAAEVSAGAHRLPQVQGRVDAEHGYARLESRLGCPRPRAVPVSLLTGAPVLRP